MKDAGVSLRIRCTGLCRGRDNERMTAAEGGRRGGNKPLLTGSGFPDAIKSRELASGIYARLASEKQEQ